VVETAMNPKVTAIMVILLLAGGSYLYFFELQTDPEETSGGAVPIHEREYGEYDLVGLEVVGSHSSAYFARAAEASTQGWAMLWPEAWPPDQIDQVRVNGSAYRLGRLTASQIITGVTDLAQYGLAPARLTVTLTISNGEEITFFAGAQTAVNDNRYLQRTADDQTVYLVYGLAVDELQRLLDDPPLASAPLPATTATAVR
jgi:hypothetical protein